MPDRLTPAQIRGARGMLDWSILQMAAAAGVSVSTVKRMETTGQGPVSDHGLAAVKAALEAAGIQPLFDDGEGVGLRFQPR